MKKSNLSALKLIIGLCIAAGFIQFIGFIAAFLLLGAYKNLKAEIQSSNLELEKTKSELDSLKGKLDDEYKVIKDLQTQAELEAETIIKNAKSQLIEIERKVSEKNNYIQDIEKYSTQYEDLVKKVDKEKTKLSKIKSAYDKVDYTVKKYNNLDIFNDNITEVQLTAIEKDEISALLPTVNLKLHSMDVKDLRKAFNENNKLINEVLERYEKRYNTKANLAIYRLMVIALRAEQQNILYNLKYDKLEKSIDDVKKTAEKYLAIADDGNKQILGTITKFINEIEFFFMKSVEIEYEYYVKKEQQKAEQAALREQMKQEAEERKLLLEQQKQVEKEEEKYKLEIQKVQEQLQANSEDEEKLKQLQARIDELNNQLESVEHKKEEIISRQNGKAGYVYVISNLGAFGDNVFKVGMTRRLDPMDRVKELGDASVPFSFDVHSFIFSDDAVCLEQKLHEILNSNRVNKINLRKEFFRTDVDKLQSIVEEIDPSAEFNITMLAEEYRQTLSLDEENSISEIA